MAAGDITLLASEAFVNNKVGTDVPTGAVFTDTVYDDSTTTKLGNEFNGTEQLVQTDSDGKLPALDGSLLTGLATGGIDDDVLSVDSAWSSSKVNSGLEKAKQAAVAMAIVF